VRPIADERALWLSVEVLPHEAAMRAWLRGKRVSPHDIDDTIQETYAVLATMAAVNQIADPRAYSFSVAYSIVLQRHRRARVVPLTAIEAMTHFDPPSDELSAERRVAGRQELQRLAAAIADLPVKCRTAFILRKIQGLSQRETAKRMGISENTVEKHIAKGVHHLMAMFADGGKRRHGPSTKHDASSAETQRQPRRKPADRS
jgi:RNA polymerase sigma-70 factor (ECF subfamily)